MTIWGAWSSNGHTRVGVDYGYSGNILNVNLILETHWKFSGNSCTVAWSGSWAGSNAVTVTRSNPSSALVWGTGTFAQSYNSTATLTFTISGFYDGAGSTSSVTFNPTLGPLPPAAPGVPTGTYVTDAQVNVAWVNNPTGTAPYDNVTVIRRDNITAGVGVAVLAGSATTFSDTGLVADRKFSHFVTATNSAGAMGSGWSDSVYTTPAPCSGLTTTKLAGGNIRLDWTNTSTYSAETVIEVGHGSYSGGVTTWDGSLLTTTAAGAVTATHTAPSTSIQHVYRVRSKSPSGLVSSWFVSGVVTLLARPNAPTGLTFSAPSMSGSVVDASGAITLGFVHNPSDSSAQSAYEVETTQSTDAAGTTWGSAVLTGKITSTTPSRTYAANTWAQNRVVRWRVRTWGEYAGTAPTYSDWSAYATFYTSTTPTASITTGSSYTSSVLTVVGVYADAEGSAQEGARWTLKTAGGTVLDTVTLGAGGSANFLTYTFATRVADATTYTVAYQVQDTPGLWSNEVTRTINVAYDKPATPTLTVIFANGAVTGTIVNPAPGAEPPAAYNVVYRNGVVIASLSNVSSNSSFTDPIPPLGQMVSYQVQAISALPSASLLSAAASVSTAYNGVILNSGPGMSQSVQILKLPKLKASSGRQKVLVDYDSVEDPTQYSGVAKSYSGTVTGLATASEITALEDLVNLPEPGCYRDGQGRKIFVSLLSISYDDGAGAAILKPFSIPIRRTSYSE